MSKKKKKPISTFRLSESSLLLTHPGNTGTCCGADAVAAASSQMSPINAERENKKIKIKRDSSHLRGICGSADMPEKKRINP